MKPSGIGMFLVIAVGIGVLAGWLKLCYPAVTSEVTADASDSFSWILLIVFAVIGVTACTMAAQLLHSLLIVLRSAVQVAVISALVVGGILLWRGHTARTQSPLPSNPTTTPTASETTQPPDTVWWEQSQ